jgi:hypothetical protein
MKFRQLLRILCIFNLLLLVTGCRESSASPEICEFKDTLIDMRKTSKCTAAVGLKGIYVISGEYQVIGKVVKAGTLLGYTSSSQYRIYELLEKYPDYASPEAVKAARKQQVWINKHGVHSAQETTGQGTSSQKIEEEAAERSGEGRGCGIQQYQPPDSHEVQP